MTLWWHTDQTRLRDEKSALAALEAEAPWLENIAWGLDDEFRLRALFDLVRDQERLQLTLTYHNTFPSSPPSVRPVDAKRLSSHQYGTGGDLCLQIRPDNWRPEFTGAQMIESAYALLSHEAPGADGTVIAAPGEHDYPETLSYRGRVSRFYVTPSSRVMLLLGADSIKEVTYTRHWCGDDFVIVTLHDVTLGDETHRVPDVPSELHAEGYKTRGRVLKIQKAVNAVKAKTYDALIEELGEAAALADDQRGLFLVDENGAIRLVHRFPSTGNLSYHRTLLQPNDASRSGDGFENLQPKRVGVVGLGSLGSKIAASLARTGIGRFELVDGDVLHAGNLERHDADWRDIALHKADLVARRLNLISPNVRAHAWRTEIGAQVSAEEAGNVDSALGGCDLIIDATANPDVFNHLAGLAMRANKSLVWGGIYAGGVGGEIARSRPGLDAAPYDVRDAITAFEHTVDEPAPRPGPAGYDGEVDGVPWVAGDPDVAIIASHMSALALDTLLGREPSRFDAPAYLIGHDRTWLFDGAFHTQPIVPDAPVRDRVSPTGEDGIEKGFVDDLIKTKIHEIAASKKDD